MKINNRDQLKYKLPTVQFLLHLNVMNKLSSLYENCKKFTLRINNFFNPIE